MFFFKKLVGPFLFPLSVCLEIMILGLLLLWFTRKKGAGKALVTLGIVLFALLSYAWLPDMLLRPLESKYPPLMETAQVPKAKYIVVLGGGHTSDPRLPAISQLQPATLARLAEGIRLHQALPGSKLVLSGGILYDPMAHARVLEQAALSLGVKKQNLLLEDQSRDTEEEAVLIKKIVGTDPLILVTSAAHMPRSMALFKKAGLNPIAAPADFEVRERQTKEVSPAEFFPDVGDLRKAQTAVYEYLGMAWAFIRGKL